MKRKNDKKVTPRGFSSFNSIDDDNIMQAIQFLGEVHKEIRIAQVGEQNAQSLVDKIDNYRKLSDRISSFLPKADKTGREAFRNAYNTARGGVDKEGHSNEINRIKKLASASAQRYAAKVARDAQLMKQQQDDIAEAKTQCEELLRELNTLAEQIVNTPEKIDEQDLNTQYTRAKTQLQRTASRIPVADGKKDYTAEGLKAPDELVKVGKALQVLHNAAGEHRTVSDRTRKEALQTFQAQKSQAFTIINNSSIGQSKMSELRAKVTTLDKEVKQYDKEADALKEAKDIALAELVETNLNEMQGITQSSGLVGTLLQIAPQNIREGLKSLISNQAIAKALMQNPDVVRALGDTSLQEGFKQITMGNVDGTVATVTEGELTQVNPLSAENQLAVIDAAISALSSEDDNPDSKKAIEALRFVRRTVAGMQRLANGDVSHLSFILLSKDGKSTFVTHLSVADALNNPASWTQLVNSLAGADAGEMLIEFSDPKQAAFLSMLAQQPDFLKTAKNVRSALEQAYGNKALTQGSEANALVQVFSGALAGGALPQPTTLGGVVDLMLLAAGDNRAIAQLFGSNALAIKKQLDLLNKVFSAQPNVKVTPEQMPHLVEGVAAILKTLKQVPNLNDGPITNYYKSHLNPNRFKDGGTVVTVIDKELEKNAVAMNLLGGGDGQVPQVGHVVPTLALVDKDEQKIGQTLAIEDRRKYQQEKLKAALVEQQAKFDSVLTELRVIISDLYEKVDDDEKYSKVAFSAVELNDELTRASTAYFDNPTIEGFTEFQKSCRDGLAKAAAEFEQHRGVWHASFPAVIKGILGVLLGVLATVSLVSLPFLIAERESYVSTFFSTPETTSSKRLSEIVTNLKTIEDEIKGEMARDDFELETSKQPSAAR